MTPPPPAQPDDSPLPARHRPNLGSLAKDTTEGDLWDFDDLEDAPAKSPGKPYEAHGIPVKRGPEPRNLPERSPVPPPPETEEIPELLPPRLSPAQDSVRVNVGGPKPRTRTQSGPIAGQSAPGADFDELTQWEDAPAVAEIPAEPTLPAPEPEPAPKPEFQTISPPEPAAAATPSPAPNPLPRLNLSSLERAGLALLVVLLLVGGGYAFFATIHRLPAGTTRAQAADFPIEGKFVTCKSAESFWRAPITSGENQDTFRRGTLLLPVLHIETRGGPAALRVFFHDRPGEYVGDAATRVISGGDGQVEIAATAGFEDLGMHAAYRSGQTKPWTAEVFEAPTANAPPEQFKKLFEIEISPERR